MENLPCRLDRFWRARLLKPHHDIDEFLHNLRFCIDDHSGKDSDSILAMIKERHLLDNYVEKP
jgi:hypothetical protein